VIFSIVPETLGRVIRQGVPCDLADRRPWRSLADPIVAKSSPTLRWRSSSILHLRALSEGQRILYAGAQIAWRRPLGLGDRGAVAKSIVPKSIDDIEYTGREAWMLKEASSN
jgi:hypothetical protein